MTAREVRVIFYLRNKLFYFVTHLVDFLFPEPRLVKDGKGIHA